MNMLTQRQSHGVDFGSTLTLRTKPVRKRLHVFSREENVGKYKASFIGVIGTNQRGNCGAKNELHVYDESTYRKKSLRKYAMFGRKTSRRSRRKQRVKLESNRKRLGLKFGGSIGLPMAEGVENSR